MRVHCGLMTQNELVDLITNVSLVLPYVDSVTIIDGGSIDGTVSYMRNWSRIESKIRYFIHPWRDNFPEQRNNYLSRIREIANDGDWVLAFDPDEFIEETWLRELRSVPGIVGNNMRVGFQCRSVSLRGAQRVWENLDPYWKGLFYRWHNGLRYTHDGEGAVHERLLGADPTYNSHLIYEHRKQEHVTWPRGVRNYFCGGGGPNLGSRNHRWIELKTIVGNLGIATWHQFHAYLIAGNIDQSLKDWIIRYRHEQGWDGSSEQREFYKTYFKLYHPEEEPGELQHEVIA
jgi:glycosyltransferase involved in cell wall biosynthesis